MVPFSCLTVPWRSALAPLLCLLTPSPPRPATPRPALQVDVLSLTNPPPGLRTAPLRTVPLKDLLTETSALAGLPCPRLPVPNYNYTLLSSR